MLLSLFFEIHFDAKKLMYTKKSFSYSVIKKIKF